MNRAPLDVAHGILMSGPGTIRNCVIVGNGIGVDALGNDQAIDFRNNTVIGNGVGLHGWDGHGIECWYNIIWDETSGAYGMFNDVLDLPSWGGTASGNFSQDPEFCGPSLGNYFLQSDSPCAPGNCPYPIAPHLIGALPVWCGTVKTETKTWGAIKELYE